MSERNGTRKKRKAQVKKEPEQCVDCQLNVLAEVFEEVAEEFLALLDMSPKELKAVRSHLLENDSESASNFSNWAYCALGTVREMRGEVVDHEAA
jgi:hypothetical protein